MWLWWLHFHLYRFLHFLKWVRITLTIRRNKVTFREMKALRKDYLCSALSGTEGAQEETQGGEGRPPMFTAELPSCEPTGSLLLPSFLIDKLKQTREGVNIRACFTHWNMANTWHRRGKKVQAIINHKHTHTNKAANRITSGDTLKWSNSTTSLPAQRKPH